MGLGQSYCAHPNSERPVAGSLRNAPALLRGRVASLEPVTLPRGWVFFIFVLGARACGCCAWGPNAPTPLALVLLGSGALVHLVRPIRHFANQDREPLPRANRNMSSSGTWLGNGTAFMRVLIARTCP